MRFNNGSYGPSPVSSYDKTLATVSRSYLTKAEIDPDGLARVHGLSVSEAERALDEAVYNGQAYKTPDGWFGLSEAFCQEILAKVEANEKIDAENRRKYFSE